MGTQPTCEGVPGPSDNPEQLGPFDVDGTFTFEGFELTWEGVLTGGPDGEVPFTGLAQGVRQ